MHFVINGQLRQFDELPPGSYLQDLIDNLGLKADRVAVELNGVIASRQEWSNTPIHDGDKLEIVHFVGGG